MLSANPEYFSQFLLVTVGEFAIAFYCCLAQSHFLELFSRLEPTLSTLCCGLFIASTGVCFGTVTFSFGELFLVGIGTVGGSVYFRLLLVAVVLVEVLSTSLAMP